MGWANVVPIEKGNLAGEKIPVGDFSGIMPFTNYDDSFSWFPQVSGQDNNFRYDNYLGLELENFPVYITQTLGNGEHFLAGIRTSEQDPEHPLAGTFIDVSISIRDVNTSTDRWSAFIALKICKRVYANDGHVQATSYPLGNYFPEEEIVVKNTPEITGQFPWTVRCNCKLLCGVMTHSGVQNLVIGLLYGHSNGNATCWSYNASRMKTSFFKSVDGWGEDAEIPEDPVSSPEYGQAATGKGGYNEDAKHGSFDDTSDTITLSSKPTLSVGDSGFVHAYVVTKQILQQIGTALFPTIDSSDPSLTGIPEAINYLTMVMFFNKRTDYILDVLILPITVPSGSPTHVRVGGSDLVVTESGQQVYCQAPPVNEYYVDVDCGDLSIPEYWANFLDFTGSRFKLFLPAVGYVDLQGEFINGGTINVKYRFNIVDGSFMCYVTSTSGHSKLKNSLVAQYSGVWAMHIPITGQDYTNKISGLISSVGSVAMGGMMGGGGALMGAVSSLANTAMQKPQTTHANGYNASSSFLTHRKPYLIIERQSSQFSEQYPSESGLPCYVSRKLSTVHGFTVIENPVLNIACSDVEYNELVQLLKSGIIL